MGKLLNEKTRENQNHFLDVQIIQPVILFLTLNQLTKTVQNVVGLWLKNMTKNMVLLNHV